MTSPDNSDLVIVDLGELSRTKVGESIQRATCEASGPTLRLQLDTNVMQTDLTCHRSEPAGTYIVYDGEGTIVGVTREVYTAVLPN